MLILVLSPAIHCNVIFNGSVAWGQKELHHDVRPVSWPDLHKSLESTLVTAAALPYTPILDIRQRGTELELPAALKFSSIHR